MIVGLGIDLIEIRRLLDGYSKFGELFLKKIFTEKEIEYCSKFLNSFESYAGKFAVKEAFMKAIGAGIRQGIWFCDIETLNDSSQKPYIILHRKAKEYYENSGANIIHLSITHTEVYATAIVILEK